MSFDFLDRYVQGFFPSRESIEQRLASGESFVWYIGVDPTGPDIHLGHATNLLLIKELQKINQKIIFLIGDFTARIGDPSGRDSARKVLTSEQITQNIKSYVSQIEKVLPSGSFEIKYNSAWYDGMAVKDFVQLGDYFTVQQIISRDMFQRRLKDDQPISVREFLYPLLQGYDSVAMKVDGEIGGNDQTFNMLAGRDLVRAIDHKDKMVLATKLLEDPKTKKKIMSKSEGRYISFNDTPGDMFGKVMALEDYMIVTLYTLCTEVPLDQVQKAEQRLSSGENPKIIKEELAFEIVRMYHGEDAAKSAQAEFEKIFSKGGVPEHMPEGAFVEDIAGTMKIHLGISKSEAHRKIREGAVSLNGKTVSDPKERAKPGDILRAGRKFLKII